MNIVVITGASSGIGQELVRYYHQKNWRVVFCARRFERIQNLEAELNSIRPQSAKGFQVDVTQSEQIAAMVQWCAQQNPTALTVIANAGAGISGRIQDLAIDEYLRQFDVNVWGVVKTVQPFLPLLLRCQGKIGIIGSGNSYVALPGASPYCMSKFAVRAFADSLRAELYSQKVSVTLIVPGFIQSEIRQKDLAGKIDPNFKDPVPAWIEMKATTAAKKIFGAVEKKKAESWVTFHVKLIILLEKFLPGPLRLIKNRLKL